MVNRRIRLHTAREPYISTDHRMVANTCLSSQNSGSCIDNDMILDNRVPLRTCKSLLYTQCTQRNPLVQFYVIADDTGLADDQTCTVVYVQVATDLCTGMYI